MRTAPSPILRRALLVGGHQAGEGQEAGQADPAVDQVLVEAGGTRGRRPGASWAWKTRSNSASASCAGAVAVVQVDDGAGQEALGLDRREPARGQRGDLGVDSVGLPAGGEPEVARDERVGDAS